MKIVLVGGGKVGYTIARQLTREGHDIILVDIDSQVVESVNESLDLMAICGNGANLEVLKAAEAGNADLLIAYVEKGRKGGAMTTLKYAEKKGIEIINLSSLEE